MPLSLLAAVVTPTNITAANTTNTPAAQAASPTSYYGAAKISDIDFSAPGIENRQTFEQLRHQQALHLYNEVAAAAALVIRYLRTL